MFIFPILYVCLFIASLYYLTQKQQKGLFLFLLFGLPIYIISLSVAHMYDFTKMVPFMQSFKEVVIVIYLGYALFTLKRKETKWHVLDVIMLSLFIYNLLYVPIPVGSYGFFERVLAFKSLSFFPLVYFTGRLIKADQIVLTEIFHYIALFTIVAATILLVEVITYTHIQSISGYAGYNEYFFDQAPNGSYGLTWTFEIENGMKRFASFFSTPLELASASLVSLSAVAAIVTNKDNSFSFNTWTLIAFLASLFCISFALSRASFASYFIILYAYAWLTDKKVMLRIIHIGLLGIVALFLIVSFNNDFVDFIINTLNFSNASSVGHLIEWANGIESMILHPLGIGLGESGRISAFSGFNTGGENEFIILGVQTGVITLGLYIAAYVVIIRTSYRLYKTSEGRIRRLALFLLLLKIGLIIPLFTSEAEAVIYVSYTTWILTGLLINLNSRAESVKEKLLVNESI